MKHFHIPSRDSFVTVPHGETPEDMGINLDDAVEVPRLPDEHETYRNGRFVKRKPEHRQKDERRARYHAMDKAELIERLEEIEARLTTLERANEQHTTSD